MPRITADYYKKQVKLTLVGKKPIYKHQDKSMYYRNG